jgi:hypothetical protein
MMRVYAEDDLQVLQAPISEIQENEFRVAFSADEQPELNNVSRYYAGGALWVAVADGSVLRPASYTGLYMFGETVDTCPFIFKRR